MRTMQETWSTAFVAHLQRKKLLSGVAALDAHPGCGACGNSGPFPQRAGQRLAFVPDTGVPSMGAQRNLPVRWGFRVSRSIAGCNGAYSRRILSRARAPASLRGPAISEGDVQHWCIRQPAGACGHTCSDDYLWLPLATCRYVFATGDTGVLDEPIPFIQGRPVNADEDSYFELPGNSEEVAGLYEHCVRSISNSLKFGEHGLPFIGSGDWNDGMNRVGELGKGESVWLGFFLYYVLMQFAEIAALRGDGSFAERCRGEATQLQKNLEQNGWDGEWYRRAYFDDGSPLGSSTNPECRIDSIAQSWSVLSGAGDPERSRMAMAAVDERLVRREHGLVQLLDPPFDTSSMNPGYIKGYVPGVRENGGQYTHAAIWAAMAFVRMGDKPPRVGALYHDQPAEPRRIGRSGGHL